MWPKARSSTFVLFSLLFVLTLTDPPRTGEHTHALTHSVRASPQGPLLETEECVRASAARLLRLF